MQDVSATDQLSALRAGRSSSVELVDAAIARIEAVDPAINAVVVRDFERARKAAKAADQMRKTDDAKPLLGLPVTVKEAFDVEGLPTTWGLPGKHPAAKKDSVVVQRLRDAGAVILGKTNVATMLADWQSANPVYGRTNNPWDVERTPGGSSGGAAAAIATGMSSLEFGTDLNGSLRVPASFCGVFTHRPSHGIVPMRGIAPPMAPRPAYVRAPDQAAVGPIARSAADLKLALDVIAGADIPDAAAWQLRLPPPRQTELKAFRVLVLDEHPMVSTANAIQAAVSDLAERLAGAGSEIGHGLKDIPDPKDLVRVFQALMTSMSGIDIPQKEYDEAAARADTKDGTLEDKQKTISLRLWTNYDRLRLALAEQWAATFKRWDIVVCPVAPVTAFPHNDRPFDERKIDIDGSHVKYEKAALWTILPTSAGLPVSTVPIGFDDHGLPIGIQLIGPRLEDLTPLTFASLLETKLDYPFKAPSVKDRA